MTEAEWLSCRRPEDLLWVFQQKGRARKARLFAVACCRRIPRLLSEDTWQRTVEVAERYADGLADRYDLRQAHRLAAQAYRIPGWQGTPAQHALLHAGYAVHAATDPTARLYYRRVLHPARNAVAYAALLPGEAPEGPSQAEIQARYGAVYRQEESAQADLVRDLIGNPFRPVTLDPDWLSWHDRTVVKLARAVYDQHDFERLPILADALEEAGCQEPTILDHCREPGEHARGCWVLDAVFGRG
jgi:hypothetical protein